MFKTMSLQNLDNYVQLLYNAQRNSHLDDRVTAGFCRQHEESPGTKGQERKLTACRRSSRTSATEIDYICLGASVQVERRGKSSPRDMVTYLGCKLRSVQDVRQQHNSCRAARPSPKSRGPARWRVWQERWSSRQNPAYRVAVSKALWHMCQSAFCFSPFHYAKSYCIP